MKLRIRPLLLCLMIGMCSTTLVQADTGDGLQPSSLRRPTAGDDFVVNEAMIPMRDGTKLHTVILIPKKSDAPMPILLQRTPYQASSRLVSPLRSHLDGVLGPGMAELDGYIWVFQDIRGRYGSEGVFEINRPQHGTPGNDSNTDETTDAWDTIDWLVKQVPRNNGRVGIYGTSYPGWTTLMALLDPHPALRAAVPVNPLADAWMGDDWFHNGAFRMPYAFEYTYMMQTDTNAHLPFPFDHDDSYVWWLRQGSAGEVGRNYLNDARYTHWQRLMAHPAYDATWQGLSADRMLAASHARLVPTMHVQGLFDQEDLYGATASYRAMEPRDTGNDLNYLVAGPWFHGQNWGEGKKLGNIDWQQDTSLQWRRDMLAPFLAHYLKDAPSPRLAPVTVFNTGTRQWETASASWPKPSGTHTARLYLRERGTVAWQPAASGATGTDQYVSDPAKPVPYQARPARRIYDDTEGYAAWRAWLVADQRFVDSRPDVLTYQSAPLDQDVTIRGDVIAHLFAATTGSDADWVVKLIDVFPDQDPREPSMSGYELMVSADILRGRYREDFRQAKAITPGVPLEYTLSMPKADHTFLRGHRLMVQVQSSWFPLYDRNPQVFVPSIMEAKPSDYRVATQTIYRDAAHPSSIEVNLAP